MLAHLTAATDVSTFLNTSKTKWDTFEFDFCKFCLPITSLCDILDKWLFGIVYRECGWI